MNAFLEKLKTDASDLWQRTREAAQQIKDQELGNLDAWHDLYAWADGSVMEYPFEQEEPSAKDEKMKTLVTVAMKDDKIVAPCSGLIVSISRKNNTIGISPAPDQIVALKVCTHCADFEKDAQIAVHEGQWVHTGQILVSFDKPVESKSKLLLVRPESWKEAKERGALSYSAEGSVNRGDLLVGTNKDN